MYREQLLRIPVEMQGWPSLPYKLVPRGNGRLGKVPVDRDGRPCNHRDARHHQPYTDVVSRVKQGEADGLGVVLPQGIVMLDVDDCMDAGSVDDRTGGLLKTLDSYTEISQSGRGIKTFAYGQKPGTRSRGNNLELYGPNQFAALTGRVYGAYTVLRAAQGAINTVYSMLGSAELPPVLPETTILTPVPNDLTAILQRARQARNGDKFCRLYDAGDITGYASASDADYALLNMLRFWCGPNREVLDAMMRQSALMRPKWDRPVGDSTYGHRTIERVIACGGATWQRRE